MARTRKITFSALNIVLPPPHKPERYVALFERVYGLAKKATMRGDWVGLIGELKVEDDPQHGAVVHGEFYKSFRYTQLCPFSTPTEIIVDLQ